MWILVFSKYPEPGRVNTRLCPPLTHQQAADLQRASLRHVLANARSNVIEKVVLIVTPDDSATAFREVVGNDVEMWGQGDGDLGVRLQRASAWAFDCGAEGVIFLGADSPTMRWSLFDGLPEHLKESDASMGPCADGGYYYLATRAHQPALLNGITWGSSLVATQTRERAQAAGLRLHESEPGYDIDRIEDAVRALADLDETEPTGELANTLRRILGEIDPGGEGLEDST